MTAPQLEHMRFYIVKPKAAINQIKNPTFASPDFEEDWLPYGTGVTIAETGDEARWGAYSMKVNPASGVASGARYSGLMVEVGKAYTFSCYIKGVAGQPMRIYVNTFAKTFVATGYWQRVEVSFTSPGTSSNYYAVVQRDAIASTAPFYVDGCQFEQNAAATTFFDGYFPGCHWTGAIRNSTSARSDNTGLGGELLCINDYAKVLSVHGFGMGDWNQIMTKMTSGGDLYQTHIRKSRNISMVLAYSGNNQGELQANRKVILDALRPDLLSNLPVTEQFGINMPGTWRGHEQRIIRYQGFDANGNEATEPVDIVCVFQPSHPDTPDTPVFQKDILNFSVPSGLLQGAYNEGKVLDLYADFPAEHIVKRDPQGNWCKWNGASYDSLLKGQGTVQGLNGYVHSIEEGPDGKIYFAGLFTQAGGVTGADYLARWNPIDNKWESVISGISGMGSPYVFRMAFDANGDLYIGGYFQQIGGVTHNYIAKITDLNGTPTAQALGTGLNGRPNSLLVAPDGALYAGGDFTKADGAYVWYLAVYRPSTGWQPVATDQLNGVVKALALSSNGILYVGGNFYNAGFPYLAKINVSSIPGALSPVGVAGDLNGHVYSLDFFDNGTLCVGGAFSNAGGNTGVNKLVSWSGITWVPLAGGVPDGTVQKLVSRGNKLYIAGSFSKVGNLTLADRIAFWTNGAWQPIDIDLPGTGYSTSILPASDGSLYVGGTFSTTTESENAETGIVALNLNVTSASANTYPFISIMGPGTLKAITNYTTGKSVMFDGLTLQAGEWISLNFDPLNLSFRSGWAGRGNLMRYVIPGSDYGDFYLSPGANYLSVFMTDTTAASGATIAWTPQFWGLDGALL